MIILWHGCNIMVHVVVVNFGSHNIEIEIHGFMVFIFKYKYSH